MARKFPKSVVVNITRAQKIGDQTGHDWQVVSNGAFTILVEGWSAGNRRDARDEAWHACESIGLVRDE